MECSIEIITQPKQIGYKFRCLSEENINDYSVKGENNEQFPKIKVKQFKIFK